MRWKELTDVKETDVNKKRTLGIVAVVAVLALLVLAGGWLMDRFIHPVRAEGEFDESIYLPVISKGFDPNLPTATPAPTNTPTPTPTLTPTPIPMRVQYVRNYTGSPVCYEVRGTGFGMMCWYWEGTYVYGAFPAGTYTWWASMRCGTLEETEYLPPGNWRTTFECVPNTGAESRLDRR